ncbi:DUF4239 domain-containing protein [Streptomyces sp. UNOC14_S4]|uniref:bestrophin-like domain n=1 Tax=Streptomyces sp. UNOC14_S4 TaxID=2872340 RepID=UPI001E5CECE2|nr:DUF4239 domain-containing protein [Streptomyces sp. UNOC14_S4]
MPPYLIISLIVGVPMVVTAWATHKTRRSVPAVARGQQGRESVGVLLGMVAVLYGVFLAFVVVAVWDNQTQARNNTYAEANAVARLYFTNRNIPGPQREQIARSAQSYARTLVDDEWPKMSGGHDSAKAWDLLVKLREQVQAYDAGSGGQQNAAQLILTDVEQIADSRRLRLDSMSGIVPPVLWLVLILGGVLTVGFSLALEHSGTRTHSGMLVAITALLAILLWMIWALDAPFHGLLKLGPGPLQAVLHRFEIYPV